MNLKIIILDEVATVFDQMEQAAKWLNGLTKNRPFQPDPIFIARRREFDAAFEYAVRFRRMIVEKYGYTLRFSISEKSDGDDCDRFELSLESEARQYSFTASFERVKQAPRRLKKCEQ